jgi:hypothetical protein
VEGGGGKAEGGIKKDGEREGTLRLGEGETGRLRNEISDHQESCGYEDGPWKGPAPSLLVAADF